MTIVCWVFGFLSLAVNVGLSKIPSEHFEFAKKIDLEKKQRNSVTNLLDKTQDYMKYSKNKLDEYK